MDLFLLLHLITLVVFPCCLPIPLSMFLLGHCDCLGEEDGGSGGGPGQQVSLTAHKALKMISNGGWVGLRVWSVRISGHLCLRVSGSYCY